MHLRKKRFPPFGRVFSGPGPVGPYSVTGEVLGAGGAETPCRNPGKATGPSPRSLGSGHGSLGLGPWGRDTGTWATGSGAQAPDPGPGTLGDMARPLFRSLGPWRLSGMSAKAGEEDVVGILSGNPCDDCTSRWQEAYIGADGFGADAEDKSWHGWKRKCFSVPTALTELISRGLGEGGTGG